MFSICECKKVLANNRKYLKIYLKVLERLRLLQERFFTLKEEMQWSELQFQARRVTSLVRQTIFRRGPTQRVRVRHLDRRTSSKQTSKGLAR